MPITMEKNFSYLLYKEYRNQLKNSIPYLLAFTLAYNLAMEKHTITLNSLAYRKGILDCRIGHGPRSLEPFYIAGYNVCYAAEQAA